MCIRDRVDTTIKELLKKDFQGAEEDIAKMQQMMEESNIGPKKKDAWLAFGIALCVIFANEVDGMEWRTLVDGNREAPILPVSYTHLSSASTWLSGTMANRL